MPDFLLMAETAGSPGRGERDKRNNFSRDQPLGKHRPHHHKRTSLERLLVRTRRTQSHPRHVLHYSEPIRQPCIGHLSRPSQAINEQLHTGRLQLNAGDGQQQRCLKSFNEQCG